MSNVVGELIEDVLFRLGDVRGDEFPKPVVLRAMQRLYHSLNRELKCLEAEITVNDTNYADFSTNGYITLPADWIKPYKLDPYAEYRHYEVYDDTESDTFSIYNGRLYISNVDSDSEYVVSYYSMGDTLKNCDDDDLAAGEINTPEYRADLRQILFYGTCVELNQDYKQFKNDLIKFNDLKNMLAMENYNKEEVSPKVVGPREWKTAVDPYE